MDPERWRQIESLFHKAAGSTPAERAALLDAECAGDADLRDEVLRLIDADARPHGLVDRIERTGVAPPADPLIGRVIGAYRLTTRLGLGGMGVVYRAERTDGAFEREVAIKLIRIELATETLVRRSASKRRTSVGLANSMRISLIATSRSKSPSMRCAR